MLMVMPRAASSGARSMRSNETYWVVAAVRVVLPWSTWPIVPMFRCGLVRTYAVLDMAVPRSLVAVVGTPGAGRPSPCGVRRTIRGGSASGAVDCGGEVGDGSLRGIRDRGCCEVEG